MLDHLPWEKHIAWEEEPGTHIWRTRPLISRRQVKKIVLVSWNRKKGYCQGHSICGKHQWLFGDGRTRQDFQEESGADGEAIAEELDVVSMMCAFRTSEGTCGHVFLTDAWAALMHGGCVHKDKRQRVRVQAPLRFSKEAPYFAVARSNAVVRECRSCAAQRTILYMIGDEDVLRSGRAHVSRQRFRAVSCSRQLHVTFSANSWHIVPASLFFFKSDLRL